MLTNLETTPVTLLAQAQPPLKIPKPPLPYLPSNWNRWLYDGSSGIPVHNENVHCFLLLSRGTVRFHSSGMFPLDQSLTIFLLMNFNLGKGEKWRFKEERLLRLTCQGILFLPRKLFTPECFITLWEFHKFMLRRGSFCILFDSCSFRKTSPLWSLISFWIAFFSV